MVKNKVPEKMGFNVGIKALKRMLKESKAAKPKASSKYRRKIEYGEIEYTNATIPVNFPYFIISFSIPLENLNLIFVGYKPNATNTSQAS